MATNTSTTVGLEVSIAHTFLTTRLHDAGWVEREPGADGLGMWDMPREHLRLIHSVAREADGDVWVHCSVSRKDQTMPAWNEVAYVADLLYPDDVKLVVIPPVVERYSFAEIAHFWVNRSRRPTPDFRKHGAI